MFDSAPRLSHGAVTVRGIRMRDAKTLEGELLANRPWLERWEATLPGTRPSGRFDTRSSIRSLLESDRDGSGLAFAIEVDGEFAGQLNVANISGGALASSTLGYWIARRFAGRGATTTAVALVTDHLMLGMGLHRVEICIRPENVASLRVVEKLGFRYEGCRRRYIHIDGDWRDHLCFALVREELAEPLLQRFEAGRVPPFDRSVYPVPVGGDPRAGSSPRA
ncbi:GNAT family N-acetyltransferase [Agrococcus sediminis]|uniref:GNAT family N-acetyltransferase n=1 Tax=Agrococcus sediminis TaxID=2599924 RepID=A0A5M8QIG3_9MICO|nr:MULTISPECIES: GNAT family protein [Agrococcus]KAA6434891.1 GNAT family N-acetyltransferase [Agrococcus sediminis]MDR7233185.1 ribosomal-protein-alanine N-acetyltransferase [Agrococcus sp. BE272]RWR25635.1 N-acetyltransferase [Agrococcus lahaulensis]